jgi:hypothetical protein
MTGGACWQQQGVDAMAELPVCAGAPFTAGCALSLVALGIALSVRSDDIRSSAVTEPLDAPLLGGQQQTGGSLHTECCLLLLNGTRVSACLCMVSVMW